MRMKKLELGSVKLAGMNLIEASAGTGKTYAIASLYLRLLLEQELAVDQILVVTYTEAATQELQLRIRRRIRDALDVLESCISDDSFLLELFRREDELATERARWLLERALAAFDTAAIFTIHGFALRALQDNAFESGSLYDTELIADEGELLQEIVDDFWRQHFFSDSRTFPGFALQQKGSPESFMKLLRELHISGSGDVVPKFGAEQILKIESDSRLAFLQISRLWREEGESVKRLLHADKGLGRGAESYRVDLLPRLFEGMESFVLAGNPFNIFEGFSRFTLSGITRGSKPKSTPPRHPFFEACETLATLVRERFLALKSELVQFYSHQLPLRKQSANIRFFDDLLRELFHALDSGSEALAASLRDRYRAALIDEFQDTDPVQYEIFRKIYGATGEPLFLIGDPKQAIYSFRGADIFAYMRAAGEVEEERRFTLTSNWRSIAPLLHAFNTLFHQERKPFLYDGIRYHPLVSGEREADSVSAVSQADSGNEPMQICFMEAENEDGFITVGCAERFASDTCAVEIEKLLRMGLEERVFPSNRMPSAGDIAVIVRSHRQARMVQLALRERGIAGVLQSDESIFASREAEEVRILLSALSDPGCESAVKAALVTDMLGRNGSDIDRINGDEEAWVACLESFHRYHRLWVEKGFMVMASELMMTESVRARLLDLADGERRLTNMLHCFELLHRKAEEERFGIEALATWFSEMIVAGESREEYQIRLESDEAAVRIVTVHVSKGLQYPIVFAPFLFGGINAGKDVVQFHDEAGVLIKDFGSRDIALHRIEAERESLGENLRLLYVALTRAVYRCYLFAGRVVDGRKKESPLLSPLSWLLHTSEEAKESSDVIGAATASLNAITEEAMLMQLQKLSEHSGGSIGLRLLQRALPEVHFSAKEKVFFDPVVQSFRGRVDSLWRVASFTSFSHHERKYAELPDRDDQQNPGLPAESASSLDRSVFSFPRGAKAGIMMHSIFENLDFAAPSAPSITAVVENTLSRQGFEPEWLPVLSGMVTNVLATTLKSKEATFSLGMLKPRSWVTEMEFFLPLRMLTSKELGAVLKRYGADSSTIDLAALGSLLDFREVKGMLMGFIDMVFEHDGRYYLLDWKSNHLGNSIEEYRQDSLKRAMEENLYALQYLLYTVALNRYLSMRVRDYSYASHFGGVFYLFLRGVSSRKGDRSGIFFDRPSEELIDALTGMLIEQGG